MAIETLYRSTRDPKTLFMEKNLADQHDKMLELAERLTDLIGDAVPALTEDHCEEVAIYLAKHRDIFARAFRNQLKALDELTPSSETPEA
ncbi:hypothetical protein AKN87_11915 [Thiopseudomonas alkaliphila]|uniref:YebG family protein n=1 Tax=Thiopseudomonas alkaliphila TaxID=1697053 RepID=A0A0K1XFV1_9GAMM|nr:YebG family protein [Thiopseudomonas alkaliphila]AKX45722.1 hypothetical protein AKN87_11915 [Thiopseudomonas alkaliphila]AKX46785.1 hypothetical protein AKN94_05020 [Thiopseudomonas alkaliphila]AKX48994.1 hypothetical protein AKN93_05905 [Thiopseudomonas alkaliphila]AKX50616.1 hypothetical protein AKN92_03255 [Thiopseudomonas alkaliphila]AKX54112.1 hypothetical protein AKN91_10880 [Thiopseudomonas alkaliphila]